MATVTLTIEGDANEVMGFLIELTAGNRSLEPNKKTTALKENPKLTAAQENSVELLATQPEPETIVEPVLWTPTSANIFWNALADNARQVILRISRSPHNTQKRAQIMHTLQKSGQAFAGTLSSVGHNVKMTERKLNISNLPRPLVLNKKVDSYQLDPSFVEALNNIGIK